MKAKIKKSIEKETSRHGKVNVMAWINPEIIKIRKNNGTKTTSKAGHRHVS